MILLAYKKNNVQSFSLGLYAVEQYLAFTYRLQIQLKNFIM